MLEELMLMELNNREKRHSKCLGSEYSTPDGTKFDCDYGSYITCDECKYNNQPFGRKDPEAKCNQQD